MIRGETRLKNLPPIDAQGLRCISVMSLMTHTTVTCRIEVRTHSRVQTTFLRMSRSQVMTCLMGCTCHQRACSAISSLITSLLDFPRYVLFVAPLSRSLHSLYVQLSKRLSIQLTLNEESHVTRLKFCERHPQRMLLVASWHILSTA